jgi:site-specific DNA-methyltransferase (adenine-specific)
MIKPYYSEPNITIYNGDCLDYFWNSYSETSDLILTSPPYGNIRDYSDLPFYTFRKVAHQLYRNLKDGGVLVWITGDQVIDGSESGESFRQALYFKEEVGFNLHDTMIYEKDGFAYPDSNRYNQCFEFMFIFTKDSLKTFNPIEDRKNNYGNYKLTIKKGREKDGSMRPKKSFGENIIKEFGKRSNIWRYVVGYGKSSKDRFVFDHPAIFPENLAKDHILSWSNPGDTILDPFLGSGTTARACKDLGRKCIGIEISKKYCDIAVKRLTQEVFNFE